MSSSVRSVRSLTFTFQRTVKADAPEASHSFGSPQKSTPPKQSRSSTGAKSVAATCGSRLLKTAPGRRASSATSGRHRIVTTMVEAMAEAATTAVVMVAPSTGRRSPRAVAEAFAARSEACSRRVLAASRAARAPHRSHTRALKISGEV